MSEREDIQRQIFALLRAIDVELAHGDPDVANRMRDKVGDLERQMEQREREGPPRERMTMEKNTIIMEQQDTAIQDTAAEITGTLQRAFAMLIERRDSQYQAAIAPLNAERDSLQKEYASIGEAAGNLAAVLPAQARTLQRQADELLLAGKADEAQAKLAEMEQAQAAPAAMRARQDGIAERMKAIEDEKRMAARRVFAEWYSECQAVIRPIEHGLFVVILDGLQKSFFDFQDATDTVGDGVLNTLFRLDHITGLTAGERSEEWASGNRWYSGRGRR